MPYVKRITASERFWSSVYKEDSCWVWLGGVTKLGYGRFYDGKKGVKAHRWSYKEEKGAVPKGLELDHLCRRPECVNPAHLEAVTHRENIRRGKSAELIRTRPQNKKRLYCKNGHSMKNAIVGVKDGKRRCRTCWNNYQRAYQRRQRSYNDWRDMHVI